jgi:hypothetical protein
VFEAPLFPLGPFLAALAVASFTGGRPATHHPQAAARSDPSTVLAPAVQAGLATGIRAVSGPDLRELDDTRLSETVEETTIPASGFARCLR